MVSLCIQGKSGYFETQRRIICRENRFHLVMENINKSWEFDIRGGGKCRGVSKKTGGELTLHNTRESL